MPEIRKNMPEEVKNEMIDGKKRVLTEKIPDKVYKKLEESNKKKQKALQMILQASIKEIEAINMKADAYEKLINARTSIENYIKEGAKKLKLSKKKEYYWRYDGRDSFIGIYNKPKPKKEEK